MPYHINNNYKVIHVHFDAIIKNVDKNHSTLFKTPVNLGGFSINKDRKFIPDSSNLLYYYPRFKAAIENRLCLNLNAGIERSVRKPPNLDEKLDHLLNFVINNASILLDRTDSGKLLEPDIICYRGLLSQIMCSVYANEGWTISATKWKNNIYLCATNKEIKSYEGMHKFCSWGYKFEQYMLTDKRGVSPDTSKPVYEAEEFCCVFQSKLDKFKLLYGAELDGILDTNGYKDSYLNVNKFDYVELKTSKIVRSAGEERTLKYYKFLKWWCQCYLVNIKELHCGFRNDKGIVNTIKPYRVNDLPKLAADLWSWQACINFCSMFLNTVNNTIPKDANDPYSVWNFTWVPDKRHIKVEICMGVSSYSFLPGWYIDYMGSLRDY